YSSSTPPPENAQILTTPSSSTGAPGKQWWRAGQATPQAQETTQAAQEESIGAHLSKLRELHPNLSEERLQFVGSLLKGWGSLGKTPEDRVQEIAGSWLDDMDHAGFVNGQNVGLGPIEDRLDVWSIESLEEQAKKLGKTLDDVLDEMEIPEEDREEWKKSPWGKAVQKSVEARRGIAALLSGDGSPITENMMFQLKENKKGEVAPTSRARNDLAKAILENGGEAIWSYLERTEVMGAPAKPVGAVASSALNCNPSGDCKDFCYAYTARGTWPDIILKSEFLEWAVNNDPKRFAELVVKDFVSGKGKVLYENDRALRFFDRGEGSEAWAKVIYHVNKAKTPRGTGIRVHVFSKRPPFLNMVAKENIRLLSVDQDNPEIAEGNDLPIAFVFTGKGPVKDRRTGKVRTEEERQAELDKNLSYAEKYKDRIQVVLPVRDLNNPINGATTEDMKKIRAIQPSDDRKHLGVNMCPIDDGRKETADPKIGFEVKPTGNNWTCANCDMKDRDGLGCYNGQTTNYDSFKISEVPKVLESMSNEDLTALTVLQEDANTFQQSLSVDDVKDMIRGIGRVYRRDLTPEQKQAAADESGVANGHWKAENEEQLADALEEELYKGHEDIQKAQDGTEQLGGENWKTPFRKWMRTLYSSVRAGPAGKNVNPKLAQILEGGTVAPVQKSDDMAEVMSLLSAVEYLYKESQWARYEDWTWKLPEDQKDYTVPNGRHVGPKGGRYDVIGYEVDTEGKAIGPGQTTGAGAPREALVPKETSEPVDFVKGPESVMDMTSVEDFASGLPEVSMGDLNAQVRQAYVTGQGSGSIGTTPLQPNVAVYSENENKETGEVERNLSGITTGDGHWFAIGGNTDVSVNRNGNGKIQLKYTAPDGSDHTKYSWSWAAHSSRAKFAKVGKLVESGILGDLKKRAISDISNPQPLPDQPKASGLTIQRNAMSAALVFHTARRPGATSRKSNINVPDGEKLMTSGGKISTAKAVKAVQAVKKEKEGRDVSVVKSDLLAPIMRGEGKDKVLTGFSVRTFGISTLQKRHIVPQSDGSVMLSFIGKSAKVNHAPVTDPVLAKKLIEFSKDKNLGDEDYIFSTKAWGGTGTSPVGGTSDYIDSISKGAVPDSKVTARTIRTLQANMVAKDLLASSDIPTTASIGDRNVSSLSAEEFMGSVEAAIATNITSENKKLGDAGLALLSEAETENICRQWIQRRQDSAKLAIAEPASNALGNEPTTCLDNYIDPDLFNEWNEYNQMETEELTSRIMSMDTRKWKSINKKIGDLQKKGWKISPSGVVTYARPKIKKATTKRKKK
ncbi:hypothetical protein CMI37_07950, partial [Candidatus Pacearchaeota archaeon]|nr:hypothetical protein [Candidatus Pacearchaeota archaeon]